MHAPLTRILKLQRWILTDQQRWILKEQQWQIITEQQRWISSEWIITERQWWISSGLQQWMQGLQRWIPEMLQRWILPMGMMTTTRQHAVNFSRAAKMVVHVPCKVVLASCRMRGTAVAAGQGRLCMCTPAVGAKLLAGARCMSIRTLMLGRVPGKALEGAGGRPQ